MAQSRASKGLLLQPRTEPNFSAERRKKWLADAASGFVSKTPINKTYYSAILEALWPEGHGIPGPALTQDEVRAVIDGMRAQQGLPLYKDPFRRMRELQGEEGFTSIMKEGVRYQLQSLEMRPKREPRAKLGNADWKKLKEKYGHKCANCGQKEPDVKLSPDHKVPRNRGGSNDLDNWQPLCEQCNNIKSNTCRGCVLNCMVCSWAFPEEYRPVVIADDNKQRIKRAAEKAHADQSAIANDILRDYFNKHGN